MIATPGPSPEEPFVVDMATSVVAEGKVRVAVNKGVQLKPHLIIDGDGSILMNIQELATCVCENIPVKVLLLNNQHLGMVVQWEDRFFKGNRAHTYLGPVEHPEARGEDHRAEPQALGDPVREAECLHEPVVRAHREEVPDVLVRDHPKSLVWIPHRGGALEQSSRV
mgnify:CR=1 FL=1